MPARKKQEAQDSWPHLKFHPDEFYRPQKHQRNIRFLSRRLQVQRPLRAVQVAPQEAEISSYLVGQIDNEVDEGDFDGEVVAAPVGALEPGRRAAVDERADGLRNWFRRRRARATLDRVFADRPRTVEEIEEAKKLAAELGIRLAPEAD